MGSQEPSLTYFDFLDSDIVQLRTANSTRSFKIHKDLLSAKCKAPTAAFRGGFSEEQKREYTFEDTSDGTLVRFIEWAYTGSYHQLKTPEGSEPKPDLSKEPANEHGFATENHPFLSHVQLYIFGDVYFISELKKLAFERLTASLIELGRPETPDEQLAVVEVLNLAFSKILSHDDLINWLAHYAAWCVDKLRMQGTFHDLMKTLPALGSSMIGSLNPAAQPPWKAETRKWEIPRYSNNYVDAHDGTYIIR